MGVCSEIPTVREPLIIDTWRLSLSKYCRMERAQARSRSEYGVGDAAETLSFIRIRFLLERRGGRCKSDGVSSCSRAAGIQRLLPSPRPRALERGTALGRSVYCTPDISHIQLSNYYSTHANNTSTICFHHRPYRTNNSAPTSLAAREATPIPST